MNRKYLSCADTAKLVRQALKEFFPDIKFSVRSSTYSMGASIRVAWEDGPNTAQVEAVTGVFVGSYFDSGIDYKGLIYHMLDGLQVSFGADSIHCERRHSDAAVQMAIDAVYRRFEANFKHDGIAKPTLDDYRAGRLLCVQLSGLHFSHDQHVARDVSLALYKHSDRMKVAKSATAGRVFVTHDDGYSRSTGSGFSAVSVDS